MRVLRSPWYWFAAMTGVFVGSVLVPTEAQDRGGDVRAGKTLLVNWMVPRVEMAPFVGQVKPPAKGKGYIPLTPAARRVLHDQNTRRHDHPLRRMAENTVNPPAFDCDSRGWVVPVWDQGQCGACYLVSTVRTMTCTFVKNGYGKNDGSFAMSPQFGMDCQNFGGCGGGNGTEVIEWARKNGWPAEKYIDVSGKVINDYPPYTAQQQSCRTTTGMKKWVVADWGFIDTDGSFDIELMKTAMNNFGPLNIALDAGGQFGNGTSTITSMGSSIDHEIMATAYDDNHDNGNGTKGAVKLSNQWGTDWGTGGYRWCSYGACRNVVDWFWVSATPLPPPTPPTPPVPPVNPCGIGFHLDLATGKCVPDVVPPVNPCGVGFHLDPVSGKCIPDAPPPGPGPVGAVTVTLTPEQVAKVIADSGVVVITGSMNVQQIADAMVRAAQQTPPAAQTKEPPMMPKQK